MIGTVYLLCFADHGRRNRPGAEARHYIGWALDVDARLEEHRAGRGSPLIAAVIRDGGTVTLARTWTDADRHFERRLKNRKEGPRLCPICHAAGRSRSLLAVTAPAIG